MYKVRVQLHSFACGYLVFPILLIKKTVLSPLNVLGILVSSHFIIYIKIYFWALYYIPLVYTSVFMSVPNCFDYYSFAVSFDIGKCRPPTLFFIFKITLGAQRPLRFHMNFRMDFSLFATKVIGILIGIALNL